MSHVRIISICQITITAINYAHNGAILITKQGALKKKMRFFFGIKVTKQMRFKVF